MKKKLFIFVLLCALMSQVFAVGISNVPNRGNEIIVMKGSTVIWHAKNWTMDIETARYAKILGMGGDDYFKIYTFKGTPMSDSTIQWTEYSVVDCEDLTWIWR